MTLLTVKQGGQWYHGIGGVVGCGRSFTSGFFGKGGEVAQKASIGVETDFCC